MSYRVEFFDVWQADYGGATVAIMLAGTNTLLSVYKDEALTDEQANPQTLLSATQNDINFGKFAYPLYVNQPYELVINSTDRTGILRQPITTLVDQDASEALVTVDGGSEARTLEEILALPIDVLDHGDFLPVGDPNASAATNTATLVAAAAVAAANGGGYVVVPPGTFDFTALSLATKVKLLGQGEGVTVLRSTQAGIVITIAGDEAGCIGLTLDGVNKQAGSKGVYGKNKQKVNLERVMLKNFETGMQYQGLRRADFDELSIDNCTRGAMLHGDVNASGDGLGGPCKYNKWDGGTITNCTQYGISLKYVDQPCWHNRIEDIVYDTNTGIAVEVIGARWTSLEFSSWANNTTDLSVEDGSDSDFAYENTVVGLRVRDGEMSSDMSFNGLCQDIIFERVSFLEGTFTLTIPFNAILALDCVESAAIVLAGDDALKWTRSRSTIQDFPSTTGITTGNTPTTAWTYNLAPGERVRVESVVIGNGLNVDEYAFYHIARFAHRPPSTLNYDTQTVNFTTGDILTGATSGASARIVADTDGGATGTLKLRDIDGEFLDNEIIEDESGGSATANGVMAHQNAALLGSTTNIETLIESDTDMAADFAVAADEVQILVTGETSKSMEWTVSAQVTSG